MSATQRPRVQVSQSRSSPAPDKPDQHGSFGLQLYAASNILGVGVFTLPFLVPRVGLLPALLMPYLVGRVVSPLYQRIVVAAHRSGSALSDESGQDGPTFRLATPVMRVGGGSAAASLGRLAAALRAIPTMLVYLAISAAAMGAIHEVIESAQSSRLVLGGLLLSTACAGLFGTRLSAFGSALQLSRFWIGAILIVDLADLSDTPRNAVLVLGAAAGIIGLGSGVGLSDSRTRSFGGLRPKHASAVAVMIVQLAAMATIAALVVIVVGASGRFETPPAVLLPSPSSVLVAIGVGLFSLTGTGHVNLASYPTMRTRLGVAKVVDGSVKIAVVVQSIWLLTAAATVPLASLADLDGQKSFSTVGMAQALAQDHPALGQLVVVVGATLILLALSGSTHITSESLAIEFTACSPQLTRRVQVGSTLAVAAAAIVLLSTGISATGLLAVGGLGGGLLIIFVMPILAETDPARHRVRRNQAIGIAAVGFTPSVLVQLFAGSSVGTLPALTLGMAVVALIFRTSQNISVHQCAPGALVAKHGPLA